MHELDEYIALVWECIQRSNFHFNFKAMYDRMNFDILVDKINKCTHQLTSKYCNAFDEISTNVKKDFEQTSQEGVNGNDPGNKTGDGLFSKYYDMLTDLMRVPEHNLGEEVELILNDIRFENWATDQRSRWEHYIIDQKAYWKGLVRDKVGNVFHFDVYVDKYKRQLRDEANELFQNGALKELSKVKMDEKFDEIFNRILYKAREEHTPAHRTVSGKVDRVFSKSPITLSIFAEQSKPTEKSKIISQERSMLSRAWINIKQTLSGYEDSFSNEHELERAIMRKIDSALSEVKHYSDDAVDKCIKLANSSFNSSRQSVSEDYKREFYWKLKDFMKEKLGKIHHSWDKENSVSSRFESSRSDMELYFQLVMDGFQGAELLKKPWSVGYRRIYCLPFWKSSQAVK